jgi:hypothetical protein
MKVKKLLEYMSEEEVVDRKGGPFQFSEEEQEDLNRQIENEFGDLDDDVQERIFNFVNDRFFYPSK